MFIFGYYACDAALIALASWLFGASAFDNLQDCFTLGALLAVLMRESVTVCRLPDLPKYDQALKRTQAAVQGDKSTDMSDEIMTGTKEKEAHPRNKSAK